MPTATTLYTLRPYQQQAVTATVEHFRSSDDAAVIVLPTGAGKSLVIAELARLARRRILVLAHVKELVAQNHDKFASYGGQSQQLNESDTGIYAAGLKRRDSDSKVVFGSVQSIARNLDQFSDSFSLLIIDECHRVSLQEDSQYQQIIASLKQNNSGLKVLGLTATPFRLDSGWVYRQHRPLNRACSDSAPFVSCIFELPLRRMITDGYLTPVTLLDAPIALYDFEQLRASRSGRYLEADLNAVLQRSQRATALIVEQLIEQAGSRQGVMIFAATVAHAREIMGYLPADCSAIIIGDMKPRARDGVIAAFKSRQIKFLVNVSVLTTGFDAPHVDLIAILRPTESTGLYQQIIGRGLRLSAGKEDCLVLDYAGNNHDLYQPDISEPKPDSDAEQVDVCCPLCAFQNSFWGITDGEGYLVEHYGRRCQGLVDSQHSTKQQCEYRFRFKECRYCNAENDIAARQCHSCGELLVDPDDQLKAALGLKDAMVLRCSGLSLELTKGQKKQPLLKVTYHDEQGSELQEFFSLRSQNQRQLFLRQFYRGSKNSPSTQPSIEQLVDAAHTLRNPDFVIARKQGHFWQVKEKIFDYEGRYRRAHQL